MAVQAVRQHPSRSIRAKTRRHSCMWLYPVVFRRSLG
ncbi:hypothetical protein F383_11679 [Gossypium arboreum]|uniref:Uncharacterized protein n=1 Tax=Gossypium arboreum TaxID=29729 RepID=A0A0B0NDI7_GOSAR|nr:hypothetical protein F383_11679 [Gossypium arboreum]